MTNREKFKSIFGVYAEEFWAYPKDKMLDWLQYDVPDTNVSDMISRQAAIDAIVNTVSEIGSHDNSEVARYGATFRQHEIINILEQLPPAQRKGRWHSIGNTGLATCECGCITDRYSVYNYCPKCGADMREGSEDAEIH